MIVTEYAHFYKVIVLLLMAGNLLLIIYLIWGIFKDFRG